MIGLVFVTIIVIVLGNTYYNSKISNISKSAKVSAPTQEVREEKEVFSGENIYIYSFNGGIDVYIKSSQNNSDKYIGYHINHSVKELDRDLNSSNYDVWNLSGANEFRRAGETSFLHTKKIVTNGEWELALREKGANDFVGGVLHGDEITTDIKMYIDNENVNTTDLIEKEAKEVKIITESQLYRDNTITDELQQIAVHHKTYTFNKDGLVIEQEISFNQELELEKSYLAMLPILRKSNGETGLQITDMVTSDFDNVEYDVTEEGFKIPELTSVEASKVQISGKESGIVANVEILEKSPEEPTIFHLANVPDYNKLYFAFNEDSTTVDNGDVWKQTTKYKIDTIGK